MRSSPLSECRAVTGYGCTASKRFQAATLPAAADGVPVLDGRGMPDIARASVRVSVQQAPGNESCADAGTDRHIDHVALALAESGAKLAQGQGIDVVIDPGRHLEPVLEAFSHWIAVPSRHDGRSARSAGRELYGSGQADSDAPEVGQRDALGSHEPAEDTFEFRQRGLGARSDVEGLLGRDEQGPLFVQLVEDERAQVRAFSLEFTFVNLGIGLGALIAGSVVSLQRPGTFTVVYVLDALSFAVPVVVIAGLRLPAGASGRSGRGTSAEAAGGAGVSYRTILRDGRFVRYAVLTALLGFCGHAALDAAFVGYSATVVRVRLSPIADAFAVNTGVIVAFQHLVTRAVVRVRRTTALAVTAASFGGAWVVEWAAGHFRGQAAGSVLVVAFGAVFAVGEMALSPVRAVLLNALATEALRGRYNAAGYLAFQASNVAAPAVVGVLLGASLGGPMLLGLAGLGGGLYALGLRRHLIPSQDNQAGAGRGLAAT